MFAVIVPVAFATRHIPTFTSSFITTKPKYGQSVRFRGKSTVIFRAVRPMTLYGVVAESTKKGAVCLVETRPTRVYMSVQCSVRVCICFQ